MGSAGSHTSMQTDIHILHQSKKKKKNIDINIFLWVWLSGPPLLYLLCRNYLFLLYIAMLIVCWMWWGWEHVSTAAYHRMISICGFLIHTNTWTNSADFKKFFKIALSWWTEDQEWKKPFTFIRLSVDKISVYQKIIICCQSDVAVWYTKSLGFTKTWLEPWALTPNIKLVVYHSKKSFSSQFLYYIESLQ